MLACLPPACDHHVSSARLDRISALLFTAAFSALTRRVCFPVPPPEPCRLQASRATGAGPGDLRVREERRQVGGDRGVPLRITVSAPCSLLRSGPPVGRGSPPPHAVCCSTLLQFPRVV